MRVFGLSTLGLLAVALLGLSCTSPMEVNATQATVPRPVHTVPAHHRRQLPQSSSPSSLPVTGFDDRLYFTQYTRLLNSATQEEMAGFFSRYPDLAHHLLRLIDGTVRPAAAAAAAPQKAETAEGDEADENEVEDEEMEEADDEFDADEEEVDEIAIPTIKIINRRSPTCGGIAGRQCPVGYECKLLGNYPDALGSCLKRVRRRSPRCGGITGIKCPEGLTCQGMADYPDALGSCVEPNQP